MELLKLLSTNEIVAQILGFLLLFFLLRAFFWKKVLKLLDARKERIAADLKKIEDARIEVARLKEDYAQKIDKIEDTAKARIEEAMEQGKKITEEIRKKSYIEAEDIIESARANIKHELSKAKEELKEQIIDLTIKAAESLVQEKLTEDDDRKLVEGFLDKIDEIK